MTTEKPPDATRQTQTRTSWFGRFIDRLSLWWLLALAAGMALAPWPAGPMPHLLEKIGMLVDGELTRPIDIFDLVVHASPLALLITRLIRQYLSPSETTQN